MDFVCVPFYVLPDPGWISPMGDNKVILSLLDWRIHPAIHPMLTDLSFTATLIWIICQELATFNVKGSFSEQFVIQKKEKSMEPQNIFEPYNEDDTEEILKSVLVMAPVLSLDLPDCF